MLISSLTNETRIPVTTGNAAALSLLANDFFLSGLAAECATFSIPSDPISSLSERVCKLELQISSFSNPPSEVDEEIESQERGLESLRLEVERQRELIDKRVTNFLSRVDELERECGKLRGEVELVNQSTGGEIGKLKSEMERLTKSVSGLAILRPELDDLKLAVEKLDQGFPNPGILPNETKQPVERQFAPNPSPLPVPQPPSAPKPPPPSTQPQPPQSNVEIPMKKRKSLDGIILGYLTKKHSGNVHEKGIITITSKSILNDDPRFALKNVADLGSGDFRSKNDPWQWVCWDFREMRVRLTHYTICAGCYIKSWIVEGSLDGSSWTEIDRQTENQDFKLRKATDTVTGWDWDDKASFAVPGATGFFSFFSAAKLPEFRFIRLTQTSQTHDGTDYLILRGLEFFGTLSQ
jgi:hypothetical protein